MNEFNDSGIEQFETDHYELYKKYMEDCGKEPKSYDQYMEWLESLPEEKKFALLEQFEIGKEVLERMLTEIIDELAKGVDWASIAGRGDSRSDEY